MEVLSGVNLSRFAPFYFIRQKKVGRKPSRAALVFSHARQRDFMRLYVIQRMTSKGWYNTNYYEDKETAIIRAENFHAKDGCFYRVVEYQRRDIVINIKKGG